MAIAIRQPAPLISIASKPAGLWSRAGRLCLLSRWRQVGVIAFVLLELARVRDIRGDARNEAGGAVLRTERVEEPFSRTARGSVCRTAIMLSRNQISPMRAASSSASVTSRSDSFSGCPNLSRTSKVASRSRPTGCLELDFAVRSQRGDDGGGKLHPLPEIHLRRDSTNFAVLSKDMWFLTENRSLGVREFLSGYAEQVALKHPEDALDRGTEGVHGRPPG